MTLVVVPSAMSNRYQIFKEVLWKPSTWVINGLYSLLSLALLFRDNFASEDWKKRFELLGLMHKLPWWGWLLLILSLNVVLLFEGATRAIHERESRIRLLASELERIRDARPHVRPSGSAPAQVVGVRFTDRKTFEFTAPFIGVRFINDPILSESSAIARDVGAKVSYFVEQDSVPSLEIDGRWPDTDQPSIRDPRESRSDLLRTDFKVGQEHDLDIGFKDPQTGTFFAWNNDNYDHPEMKKPEHQLNGQEIRVEVRLRGTGVDEKFSFRFAVQPELRVLTQPKRK